MRRTFVAAICFAAACGTDVRDPVHGGPPPSPGELAYLESCAACHGDDALGTQVAPAILSTVAGYATYVVRNGRDSQLGYPSGMKAIGTDELSDEDLSAVLAYLDSAPEPTTGADLYARHCVNCHGADGDSGRVGSGVDIVREAGNIAGIIRRGHGGHFYYARTSYMPSWTADQISDANIELIRQYVTTL